MVDSKSPLYERDKRCISCKFARACLSVSSHTALLLSAILDYGKGSRIVENSYLSFSVVYTRLKKMYVGYVTIIHQFVAPKTEQTTKIMKPNIHVILIIAIEILCYFVFNTDYSFKVHSIVAMGHLSYV